MKDQLHGKDQQKENNTRAMDEKRSSRAESAFQGKNTGSADFQADEADDWRVAPAGVQAWYWPRSSTLDGAEFHIVLALEMKEAVNGGGLLRRLR